ncbi:MAG: hypothetical protein RL198_276 [Actinomycetota bacterium]
MKIRTLGRRVLSGVTTFSLVLASAVALTIATPSSEPAAATPSGSAFDPGHIISDSVFYDGQSMTASDIQKFLDARVTNCRATDPAIPCLKDFAGEIVEKPAVAGRCAALPAKPSATAAEMIAEIARACGINPKVLIVTLQKEQGLVTSTKPTSYMYRAAMGYGCPDSDPAICGKVFVGLFNQLYNAASQFRWYGNPAGSFTWLKPGRTVSVRFHPKASCGTKSFPLVSQATAALYYYTPYTPNQAALDNLYGTGDSCSAYGNRNFWRFFHDWFGNPLITDAFVADPDGNRHLVFGGKVYSVTDDRILTSIAPLEPAQPVSAEYVSSITSGGELSQLARSTGTGRYFLLVGGARYLVGSCALAEHYGQDCDTATPMSSPMLLLFSNGGELTQYLKASSGDASYWVEEGNLIPVGSASDLPVSPAPIQLTMNISLLTKLTAGSPNLADHTLYPIEESTDLALSYDDELYRVSGRFVADIPDFVGWFRTNQTAIPGDLVPASSGATTFAGLLTDARGKSYLVTSAGKQEIAAATEWAANSPVLPNQVVDRIPTVSGILSTPLVVVPPTITSTTAGHLIDDGQRRTIRTQQMVAEYLDFYRQSSAVPVSSATISLSSFGGAAIAPGSLVRESGSRVIFLIDGAGKRIKLSNAAHAASVAGTNLFDYPKSLLTSFPVASGSANIKVSCGGATFLVDGGRLMRVGSKTAAQYPGSATKLDASTCHGIGVSDAEPIGQFVRDKNQVIYLVQNGARYKFSSVAAYESARGSARGFVDVSDYFLSKLPSKGNAPARPNLVSGDSVPGYDFGIEVPGSSSGPQESAPPTSPAEGEGGSVENPPAPSEPTLIRYVVVSGDTLLRIANRFSTTVQAIQAANNITNPNRIFVGQVLRIPTQAVSPEPAPQPEPETEVRIHTVVAGDTLFGIARKYRVSASKIAQLNNLANPNFLRIGQRLKIPTS